MRLLPRRNGPVTGHIDAVRLRRALVAATAVTGGTGVAIDMVSAAALRAQRSGGRTDDCLTELAGSDGWRTAMDHRLSAAQAAPTSPAVPSLWADEGARRDCDRQQIWHAWCCQPLSDRASGLDWLLERGADSNGDPGGVPEVVHQVVSEVRGSLEQSDPLLGPHWRGRSVGPAESRAVRAAVETCAASLWGGCDRVDEGLGEVQRRVASGILRRQRRRRAACGAVGAVAGFAMVAAGSAVASWGTQQSDLAAAAAQAWPSEGSLTRDYSLLTAVRGHLKGVSGDPDLRVVFLDRVDSRVVALAVDARGGAHALVGPSFVGPALSWVVSEAVASWEYRRADPGGIPRPAITAVIAEDSTRATLISVFPAGSAAEQEPRDPGSILEVAGFEGSWADDSARRKTHRYPILNPSVRATIIVGGPAPVTEAVRLRIAPRDDWSPADFTWGPGLG